MVVRKDWIQREGYMPKYTWRGYFLFGIIPLYLIRVDYNG